MLTRDTHGDLSAWERDWRKRWHGQALAVVRPGSTSEVAAVVQACARHGVSIVPQGGNTGLVGGGVPDKSGSQVLLSLQRMNRVRGIDAANLAITAEAGCVLQAVQEAAAALRIEIEDNGSGIPPEQQARVFERFESRSQGSEHRGAGLGLSIVKSLVALHRGRVNLDSKPGIGTRVTVRLPVRPAGSQLLEQHEHERAPAYANNLDAS